MPFARIARSLARPIAEAHAGDPRPDRQRLIVCAAAGFWIVEDGLVPIAERSEIVLLAAKGRLIAVGVRSREELRLAEDRGRELNPPAPIIVRHRIDAIACEQ